MQLPSIVKSSVVKLGGLRAQLILEGHDLGSNIRDVLSVRVGTTECEVTGIIQGSWPNFVPTLTAHCQLGAPGWLRGTPSVSTASAGVGEASSPVDDVFLGPMNSNATWPSDLEQAFEQLNSTAFRSYVDFCEALGSVVNAARSDAVLLLSLRIRAARLPNAEWTSLCLSTNDLGHDLGSVKQWTSSLQQGARSLRAVIGGMTLTLEPDMVVRMLPTLLESMDLLMERKQVAYTLTHTRRWLHGLRKETARNEASPSIRGVCTWAQRSRQAGVMAKALLVELNWMREAFLPLQDAFDDIKTGVDELTLQGNATLRLKETIREEYANLSAAFDGLPHSQIVDAGTRLARLGAVNFTQLSPWLERIFYMLNSSLSGHLDSLDVELPILHSLITSKDPRDTLSDLHSLIVPKSDVRCP